ncbi:alpha/beta fold hydrolase [Rufibacter glacialis]|uniref:Alpha/beta fold hydrolase n=1 Tax=Rufibacter glacialis TaxID=1259555 RepID=A0A5M8QM87_9BACT|nr:alpha/beta hydrolase [Rufibacter glacialis]KAA6437199.1 alpha/beta hydrolase [Rufibacter glacialis]GGK61220.1 alpha/beta hydrolase [Rufibacter glacialis]
MNSTALAYTEAGSGPVIVFLHGFCESKDVWTDFTKPLEHQFRIIAFDLPGHGESPLPSDFSMESQARQVQEALQDLKVEKCLLVGHSMGGYVALALAESFPDQLYGLCLFHSSALPDTQEKQESRDKTAAFVQKHGLDKFMETFVSPLFAESNRESSKEAIQKMQEIGKATPVETVLGCLGAMRDRPDRTEVLKTTVLPVFFLAGKEDPAVPLEAILQQCHLPENSMTYFLGHVGHMGMFENPALTRQALLKFAETLVPTNTQRYRNAGSF